MALSQTESADLMKDPVFIGRVKVCCLTYAQYLQEQLQVPLRGSQMRWIQQVIVQPDQVAQTIVNPVVQNPNVQADGAAIDDPGLQAAVQAVADQIM